MPIFRRSSTSTIRQSGVLTQRSARSKISALASTEIGSDVLQQMLTVAKANPTQYQIALTANHPDPNTGAVAAYWSVSNSIDITNMAWWHFDDPIDAAA